MAEFIKIMSDKKRMCETCIGNCETCPLCSDNNGTKLMCEDFFMENLKKAEKIIEDWTKKNPVITNADKFKEVFGYRPHVYCFAIWNRSCKNILSNCNRDCKNCPYCVDAEYHVPEGTKNI